METFNFQRLDAYVVAREIAVLVQRAGIRDGELQEQATRAAKSCFLNLAEGLPSNQTGMRRKFFRAARGSLAEVAAAFDLAVAVEAVSPSTDLETKLARLASLLGGLIRKG